MKIFFFLLLCYSHLAFPAQDIYSFSTTEQSVRFDALLDQYRCLVCQNQNLAQSNSALANDLRGEIYKAIAAGKSDEAVTSYLVARYGKYILYKPPLNTQTLILWVGPVFLSIAMIIFLLRYITKRKTND
jgi:cytochrome c-type biogenesis protein CcmH